MTVVAYVSLSLLALAAVVGVVSIAKRSHLGDRAVAFDMLTSVVTCGLLVGAGVWQEVLNLDLAVVLGLLGFVASLTIARFVESQVEQE
ncbi:MAG: cation:proton antiporter [Actinobacteria bacterium]|nr:cation:proton antiporter [Actinomycetota bacterium]